MNDEPDAPLRALLVKDPALPETDPAIALLVIRGVGDSGPDVEMLELLPHLAGHGALPCLVGQVNWSATVTSPTHVDFTNSLASAWLNCIHVGWPPAETLPRWQARLLGLTRTALDAIPLAFLVVGLVALTSGAGLTRLALQALTVLVLAPLGAAMLTRRLDMCRCAVRCVVLAVLWPIACFAFLPARVRAVLFGALCLPGLFLSGAILARVLPSIGVSAIGNGAYDLSARSHVTLLVMWAVGGLTVCLTALLYRRLERLALPALKIAADIVRYLGDREYAESLQRQVVRWLLGFTGMGIRHVVLVTHSLGSVVAVDTLRQVQGARDVVSVVLYTSGSPLRRYFHRFFPGAYPHPLQLLRQFRRVLPGLLWVNIFRPGDEVGTDLQLPSGCERTTGRYRFPAHPGYWDDPHVHTVARECRDTAMAQTTDAEEPLVETFEWRHDEALPLRGRRAQFTVVRAGVIALLPLLALAPVRTAMVGVQQNRALLSDGVSVEGEVFRLITKRPTYLSARSGPTEWWDRTYAVRFVHDGRTMVRQLPMSLHRETAVDRLFEAGPVSRAVFPMDPPVETDVISTRLRFLAADTGVVMMENASATGWPWFVWATFIGSVSAWVLFAYLLATAFFDAVLAPYTSRYLGVTPPVRADFTPVFSSVIREFWPCETADDDGGSLELIWPTLFLGLALTLSGCHFIAQRFY